MTFETHPARTVPATDGGRRPMRVLHVYTEHRGRGGAERFAELNMEMSAQRGVVVGRFTRKSDDLPQNILGRLQAGVSALARGTALPELERELERFQPDLIHLYDYFPLISAWLAPVCARRNIPVILHCVHYRLTCPIATHYTGGEVCTRCTGGREYWAILKNCRSNLPESITVALHNISVRRGQPITAHVNRFIAPSEFTREWLTREADIESSRITTVMPFVPIPPEPVADPAAGQYIAFAGRFAREKGIGTLLEAARMSGLPLRLSRSADQEGREFGEGVEEVVTQSRAELDAFYRGARALVVPSEWFETFGLVAAEGMSHGIPVIASRVGALQNVIDDEVSGLFFEMGNARALAAQMTRIWQDPELCRRLGRAGRQKVMANWTAEHYLNQMLQVYDEVIAASRHSGSGNHASFHRHSNV